MTSLEKRVHARRAKLAQGKHVCHWPTCARVVPPSMWGCKKHWFRLPKEFRDRIWETYVPGQEVRKDPSVEYLEIATSIEKWAICEVRAGRGD